MFLTAFVGAQYGSPVGNSNPGYGGTGSVPTGDYGHKGPNPVAPGGGQGGSGAGSSDGNSEVSLIFSHLMFVHQYVVSIN